MFSSLLLYLACMLYRCINISKLSDGLDDINDDRGLYQVQNLYEFVKEGYVNSLGSVGSYGTDIGMNNSSGLPKCGKYTQVLG